MIHQNECAACGDALAAAADQQQQQCVHCSERFCSARCALIGAPPVAVRAASYVRLLDTNYIDGMHKDIQVYRESHTLALRQRREPERLYSLSEQHVQHIWEQLREDAFRPVDAERDHPQCCDRPFRVVYWRRESAGPLLITQLDDVPTLVAALWSVVREAQAGLGEREWRGQPSMMRSMSSMPASRGK